MATTPAAQAPAYQGLRVIELADDPGGEFCGKLLAQVGADVVKVEPPGGASSRSEGPYARGLEDPNHSLPFWYYNVGKRSVVLDLTGDAERARLRDLLAGADVFIYSGQPAVLVELGLTSAELVRVNAALVTVTITPFGMTGPWANYLSSDLVAFAASGVLACCGYDDHSIPPIRPGGSHAYLTAASFAHTALLISLVARQSTGAGDFIDVAVHDSMAITVELANAYWFYSQTPVIRQTCRHAQPLPTARTVFECADGRHIVLVFILNEQRPWAIMVDWLASHELAFDLSDERYLDPVFRQQNFGHIQEVLEAFFLMIDAESAFREGQQRGLPLGAVFSPEEVLQLPHLRARGFFDHVRIGDVEDVVVTGAPYRFSAFPAAAPAPAPGLGEHNGEVFDSAAEALIEAT